MLKYALVSYLCLLIGVQSADPDEFMKSYFRSPVLLPKNYLIAPEASLDKKSFAVLHYKQLPTQLLQLEVELYILNEISVEESRKCVVNVRGRREADRIGISALHRLSNDKLVFTWYDDVVYKNTIDRRYNIEVENMYDDCKSINIGMNNFIKNPIVAPSLKSHVLDLLVNDNLHCGMFGGQCRIYFNFAYDHIGRHHPLNIKYNWTSIQVQRLHDRDLLIYGQKGNSFKVSRLEMIMDNGEKTFLKVIGAPSMEVVATGLSVCWNVHPGTSIQLKCIQFNEQMNNYILNQNVNLYEDLHLIDVHASCKGQVLLIAKKQYCNNEDDCWKLLLMKVKQGRNDAETTEVSFPCTGDQDKLVVFSSMLNDDTKKIEIHYACRNHNGYAYSYLEI